MDEMTSRRVCSLVAGVLTSDGEMAPEEREFLKRVMTKLGLQTDTILMATDGADVAEELDALPEPLRWEALHLVIQAAAADGQIVPAERAMVDAIARYLGVEEADVVAQLQRVLAGG